MVISQFVTQIIVKNDQTLLHFAQFLFPSNRCPNRVCASLPHYTAMVLDLPLYYVLTSLIAEKLAKGILTIQRIKSKRWINNMVDDDTL